ncbi:hypothetical protein [Rhizohabitans arisaemae]|uniref:hypothetical protein n=1 Tax=Rhizohabitans arisaemae TaxID=2720610 RepID=UPI0024B0EC56|nr:hypothetical protein [Rhizohabitans arisaemae]
MLGEDAPPPSAIEVLTGMPFGAQLYENGLIFFDPPGLDPLIGIDEALELMGRRAERSGGGTAEEAVARLRRVNPSSPALVGPVEIGLLRHQPDMNGPIASDHYVVVLGVEGDTVLMHDPHGFPYATMPVDKFIASWRTDTIGYPAESFTMWRNFKKIRDLDVHTMLRDSIPRAIRLLGGTPPPADAIHRLIEIVGGDLNPGYRAHLTHFAVRVSARRLADAAHWLGEIGYGRASEVAAFQARLVGGLQYPLVVQDDATAMDLLRQLAPTYEQLREALAAGPEPARTA